MKTTKNYICCVGKYPSDKYYKESMEYSLLPDYEANVDLKPEPLTDEEINDILNNFIRVTERFGVYEKSERQVIIDDVSSKIRKIKLIPKAEARQKLTDNLIKNYMSRSKNHILLPGYEDNSDITPRLLTDEEINMILDKFPSPTAAVKEIGEITREGLVSHVRDQIESLEVVPTVEAINVVIDKMIKHYMGALMDQGDVLNTVCADAIGSTATQMTLDTFKLAGALHSIGTGVQSLISLIYAVNKVNAPCSVHFNTLVNAKDVYDMRSIIVNVNVMDIVSSHDIYFRRGVPNIPLGEETLQMEWWHDVYFSMHETLTVDYRNVLRLRFDTQKMYEHRITMQMVIDSMVKPNQGVFVCVPSPMKIGILDVFLNDIQARLLLKSMGGMTNASIVYLKNIVKGGGDKNNPPLKDRRIKGIPNITDLYAVETSTVSLIESIQKLNQRQKDVFQKNNLSSKLYPGTDINTFYDHSFKILIDKKQERQAGIKLDYLRSLLELSGAELFGSEKDILGSPTAFYVYVPNGILPNVLINNYITSNVDNPRIQALGRYVSAMTVGGNLVELLKLSWVDETKTTTMNVGEDNKFFGCEGARAFSDHVLVKIMDNNRITINSRHITLITDFMFNRGLFLGMTYHGISRSEKGPTSLATVERPMQVFASHAPYAKAESALDIAVAAAIGAPMPIGSKTYLTLSSPKDLEIYRQKMLEESKKAMAGKNKIVASGTGKKVIQSLNKQQSEQLPMPVIEEIAEESGEIAPILQPQVSINTSKVIPKIFPDVVIEELDIEPAPLYPTPLVMSDKVVDAISNIMNENPIKGVREEPGTDELLKAVIEEITPPADNDNAMYPVPTEPSVRRSFNIGIPMVVLPMNLRPIKPVILPSLQDVTYENIINQDYLYGGVNYDINKVVSYLKKETTQKPI